ncbi:c-type cytochrome [Advenella sp. FME57]|uniref:c-type cytochrome n=1 Tax=Advenella sp. FME57 TaxID=2742604 RepID=UPI001868CCF2|nr:c-type cytochrome [Advenella sp. FME57]
MNRNRKKRSGISAAAIVSACSVLWLPTEIASAGDIAQGKSIAANGITGQAPCMACHGANGEGMAAAGFPFLAGLPAVYLEAQLVDFAQGKRKQAVMEPIAKALSAEQKKAVAVWYASLKPVIDPAHAVQLQDSYPKGKMGAWLAQRGDWSRGLPACVQCHGPGGVGVAPTFPALAGQSAMYIKNQLLAWKTGTRADDAHGLMAHLARKLTDEEIDGVSAYFGNDIGAAAASATTAQAGGQ